MMKLCYIYRKYSPAYGCLSGLTSFAFSSICFMRAHIIICSVSFFSNMIRVAVVQRCTATIYHKICSLAHIDIYIKYMHQAHRITVTRKVHDTECHQQKRLWMLVPLLLLLQTRTKKKQQRIRTIRTCSTKNTRNENQHTMHSFLLVSLPRAVCVCVCRCFSYWMPQLQTDARSLCAFYYPVSTLNRCIVHSFTCTQRQRTFIAFHTVNAHGIKNCYAVSPVAFVSACF